jgi:hypothetical protein
VVTTRLSSESVDLGQVHRRRDVHQHADREEVHHGLVRQPGNPLDLLPQLPESGPGGVTDVRVLAGRVRLHLHQQQDPVVEQRLVRVRHRRHRLLAGQLTRGRRELVSHPAEAPLDQRQEQRLLRGEQAEQVRLADAGPARDLLGRGSRVPVHGELRHRLAEHQLAPLLGRHPRPAPRSPVPVRRTRLPHCLFRHVH